MRGSTRRARGLEAGAPEIEVTPAMIDAGADILSFYEPETDRLSETVTQIFRAMLEARFLPRP
jgi:hypothetical protein